MIGFLLIYLDFDIVKFPCAILDALKVRAESEGVLLRFVALCVFRGLLVDLVLE